MRSQFSIILALLLFFLYFNYFYLENSNFFVMYRPSVEKYIFVDLVLQKNKTDNIAFYNRTVKICEKNGIHCNITPTEVIVYSDTFYLKKKI